MKLHTVYYKALYPMLQQQSNLTKQQTTASQKVKKPLHTSENVYVCKTRKIQTTDDPTDTGEVCAISCASTSHKIIEDSKETQNTLLSSLKPRLDKYRFV